MYLRWIKFSPVVLFLTVGIGGSFIAAAENSKPALMTSSEQQVARGEMLFKATCGAYCHSSTAEQRDAPFLFDCSWIHGGDDAAVHRVISDGVPGTRMLAFAGKFPKGDEDIRSVIAFLRHNSECR